MIVSNLQLWKTNKYVFSEYKWWVVNKFSSISPYFQFKNDKYFHDLTKVVRIQVTNDKKITCKFFFVWKTYPFIAFREITNLPQISLSIWWFLLFQSVLLSIEKKAWSNIQFVFLFGIVFLMNPSPVYVWLILTRNTIDLYWIFNWCLNTWCIMMPSKVNIYYYFKCFYRFCL